RRGANRGVRVNCIHQVLDCGGRGCGSKAGRARINGVREAADNDPVEPGVVYIAPAGRHMTICRGARSQVAIRISSTPQGMLHIPSVDVMMLSVAEVFRSAAMGIIMTGMGSDGLEGMRAIA